MAVKNGYKQTEIGLIPEDWETKSASDVCDRIMVGIVIKPSQYYQQFGVPAFRSANIRENRIVLDDLVFISDESNKLLSKSQVKCGDVLTVRTGYPGTSAVANADHEGFNCIDILITRPSRQVDSGFFSRWVNSPFGKEQILRKQGGLAQKHFNVGDMKELLLPFPTLREQEAIAGALSDADAWIESLEQLIAKKRQIKQGAMQELLTGKRRLPGFSDKWETKLLGDVADVKTGPFGSALHEGDYKSTGTPIITVEHLGEFGVEHVNLPLVSDSDCQRLRAYTLELGDIVFSRVGSVDRNALIRPEEVGWLFSGRLLRVRLKCKKVSSPFLSYQFHGESFISSVRNVAVGQTMACLNTQILKGILIRLPSIEEQTAIASLLFDMDTEIESLESKLSKAREIKQGMMQELLTGRIRLV